MQYNRQDRTFDCDPVLADSQVLEFCRQGYLLLQGVVSDEINQRTCDYLDGKIEIDPFKIPDHMTLVKLERIRSTHEPSSILLEQWFLDQVILNPQAAGAIRSILGKNVGLPVLMSNHRVNCPAPAQGWHHDADSIFSPETNYLQVFLLSARYASGNGANRSPPRITSSSNLTGNRLVPRGLNCCTCWIYFSNLLSNLASEKCLNCQRPSPSTQV